MTGWPKSILSTLGLNTGQTKSAELLEAERCLSAQQISQLCQKFQQLAGTRDQIKLNQFLELFYLQGLDSTLAKALFSVVCGEPNASGATIDAVLIATAHCTSASEGEFETFCFRVLSGGCREAVRIPELQTALQSLMMWAIHSTLGDSKSVRATIAEAVEATLSGAFSECDGDKVVVTPDAFLQWAKHRAPAVLRSLKTLLSGDGSKGLIPHLVGLRPNSGLLQIESAWGLAALLPPKQQVEWELLFSSAQHGHSFNALLMKVLDAGPTLLLVRDKQGHLFGGFASESWHKNGQFYGNFHSFVFSLHPSAAFYKPLGANTNFQWCGIHFSQLPNGIGFGGQVSYFGLYVDGTLDKGMSRASATYSSPSLSSEPVFEVDTVEVWRVEAPPEDEEDSAPQKKGNILETTKETQNFLGMAGREMHTAAQRG